MTRLINKRVLLGVTGGIAAYKAAELARRLRDDGAEVRVVMTRGARAFITPLTMQTVSGHPVHLHLLDASAESGMGHIELARWADVVLIAPASANVIAKLAHGHADDLLSTLCLATQAPIAVAPAMNQQMWQNPATQANVAVLEKRGITILGPALGSQACGETGAGRLLEAAELVTRIAGLFHTGRLAGLNVVVTAGPTWEALDPVRGLTNRSSGKMGYAVATAAQEAGAQVTLISGPTKLCPPARTQFVSVVSAEDMYNAVHAHIADAAIFISVAAVADYRPVIQQPQKIKRNTEIQTLDLVKNPDILASVAALPTPPFTVGFAAETTELERHARAKLNLKGIDLIAANHVAGATGGFDVDENQLTLIHHGEVIELPLLPKIQLARLLLQHIAGFYHAKHKTQDPRRAHR